MQTTDSPAQRGARVGNLLAWRIAASITLGTLAGYAHASAFQLAEQNASGLANSYAGSAAIAEDASTIFSNPAGMTRLPGFNVSAGVTAISTTFKFADGGSSGPGGLPLGSNTGGNAGSVNAIPNAYFSWQLGPKWFIGLGASSPFGLSTKYDKNWIGRYQSTEFSIQTININPSVAYKVNDRLSIGAGLNWQRLDADYQRKVPAVVVPADMNAEAKLGGDAWGWNLGLLYQLSHDTRIGASYRSTMHFSSSGTTTLSDIPGPLAGRLPSSADNSASFTLPDTATLSIVHDLNSKWQLLGDVSWTGWSRLPSLDINNGALGQDHLTLNFRDTWRVAMGVNYQYSPGWKFKAGVSYDQSPIPNDTVRPTSLPDNDRVSGSIGAQYRFSARTTVDVGYSHLFFHPSINNSTDPKKGTVIGSWQTSADLLGVQISYRY
jgi:long-chain fatty acid transport protein